jgi:hypothetical protein
MRTDRLRRAAPAAAVALLTGAGLAALFLFTKTPEVPVAEAPAAAERRVELVNRTYSEELGAEVRTFGAAALEAVALPDGRTAEERLTKLARANGWVWARSDDGFLIADEDWYRRNLVCQGSALTRIVRLKTLDAGEAARLARTVLPENATVERSPTHKFLVITSNDVKAVNTAVDMVKAADLAGFGPKIS